MTTFFFGKNATLKERIYLRLSKRLDKQSSGAATVPDPGSWRVEVMAPTRSVYLSTEQMCQQTLPVGCLFALCLPFLGFRKIHLFTVFEERHEVGGETECLS